MKGENEKRKEIENSAADAPRFGKICLLFIRSKVLLYFALSGSSVIKVSRAAPQGIEKGNREKKKDI